MREGVRDTRSRGHEVRGEGAARTEASATAGAAMVSSPPPPPPPPVACEDRFGRKDFRAAFPLGVAHSLLF